jgi:hypothetical protein
VTISVQHIAVGRRSTPRESGLHRPCQGVGVPGLTMDTGLRVLTFEPEPLKELTAPNTVVWKGHNARVVAEIDEQARFDQTPVRCSWG